MRFAPAAASRRRARLEASTGSHAKQSNRTTKALIAIALVEMADYAFGSIRPTRYLRSVANPYRLSGSGATGWRTFLERASASWIEPTLIHNFGVARVNAVVGALRA